ncbi:Retinoic acid-induced protein 1 [Harpegnathos saltator]|uniref:Retinoic acid-induced protein 1 n=1 Tax=Harpegnathos saltator TaxID=610380 RepID=E2BIR7_HARSA|nr:Retinoic acid-induced protein 1 [Harpegnathos saltator]
MFVYAKNVTTRTTTTSASRKLEENANEESAQCRSANTLNHTSQGEKLYRHLYLPPHYSPFQNINEQYTDSLYLQNGVSCYKPSVVPSNGLHTSRVAPPWALSHNFMQWVDRGLIAHNTVYDTYDLHHKDKGTTESVDLNPEDSTELLQTTVHNDRIVNSSVLSSATNESLSRHTGTLPEETHADSSDNYRKDFVERTFNLLNIVEPTISLYCTAEDRGEIPAESRGKISYHDETEITTSSSRASKHSTTDTNDDALRIVSDIIEQCEEAFDDCATSVSDNEPLDLVINSKRGAHNHGEAKDQLDEYLSVIDKETLPVGGAIVKEINHSSDAQGCHNVKYKNYGLLQFSDLDKVSCNSDRGKELLKAVNNLHTDDDEISGKAVTDDNLKQEKAYDILDKYVTHVLPSRLSDAKQKGLSWTCARSSVKCNNIKKEYATEEEAHKTESTVYNTRLNNWEYLEMSGQYPGHSRPPVGTPPPHTVWNHLTMTQGQGLNIHPTALSGTTLNSAFYTHQSIGRTSHLTPQHAHTQAAPTWHTPTVPPKNITPASTTNTPLFNLQMLVDNRQNQNQYRNSPGSQSTLDLSSTSEIIPENYSRLPQDIPISLTARNVDKGSRNGNIISPPIPLNGETSSDSGISSSVPTPNSVSEPVSLSTKEVTTPKITVKNFESNLKGVANLHDKIKEVNVDNFAQKMINLPPSVTIERVEKKEPDAAVVTAAAKVKDTLSVIAQVPRNVLPVIVNRAAKEKDVTDSPKRESSSERDKKLDETSVRSPKSLPKRGKKGVDSLLEKLEGGNKKLGSTENIGSVIVTPVEDKDSSSVKSMSPERQKSKSPNREDEVVSPAFSNDDSNDNTKQQRRKRKLEKPVRLSKDSKTEVEDMELEPTEPSESRAIADPVLEETVKSSSVSMMSGERKLEEEQQPVAVMVEERIPNEKAGDENVEDERLEEENQPIRRRRSSDGATSNSANQRVRRKSSDDASAEFAKASTSPKNNAASNNNNATNPFNEVESELEKMFAGIVETDSNIKSEESKAELASAEIQGVDDDASVKLEGLENNILPTTSTHPNVNPIDVSSTMDTKLSGKKGKKGKAQSRKRKVSRSSENIFGAAGDPSIKDAKKRRTSKGSKKQDQSKKAKRNTKIDGLREMAYDSGSNASSIRSRGPVVHVEGPRDSPLSIQVVNAPREEEEEKNKEKRKSNGNSNAGRGSKRLSHQNDLDYRGRVNNAGLFSSTLSSRYDAHTPDSTWVCVFCKQGPHSIIPGDPSRPHPNLAGPHIASGTYTVPAGVSGDLFGPYLIGKDRLEDGKERLEDGILSADEQEITREQKKGGKNKRSLRYAGLADQFSAKMGKKKRNSVESNTNAMFTGMTMLPGEEQRWEVWLHEQCAVWAAGVYMAGGRVTGLQEAVWDAAKSICCSCGLTGANIGCIKRGCKAVSHYPCALTKGWHLDTNQYIPKCNLHRVT